MTYGDGVCDVDINKLLAYHQSHGKLATLTAVKMAQDKGVLDIEEGAVKSFREKNKTDGAPINAGYMVLQPEVFDLIEGDDTVFERKPLETLANEGQLMSYIHEYLDGDSCIFERKPLETLAAKGELMSYIHEGFWQCMDNVRERDMLEKLLQAGKAPWKKWERTIPQKL